MSNIAHPQPRDRSRRSMLGRSMLALATVAGLVVAAESAPSQAAPAAGERRVSVAGEGSVPGDASAAVLNIGAARASSNGYVVAWPCGEARPVAASVNYRPGAATSNSTVVALGDGGDVCLWSSSAVDLVVDVNGAYPAGSELVSFVPQRLLDTRGSSNTSGTRRVSVAGEGSVPGDASAAVLNIGAARASSNGYVVAWPCGEARPVAASVNYRPGAATSNSTVVALGDGGDVCLWSSSAVDLVVDVNGAYPAGSELVSFVPNRVLDTRDDEPSTPPPGGRFTTLPPGSALPSGAACATRVRSAPETRPENAAANNTMGGETNGRYPRVDGNFTGTTDEILQWAACKWGIDEDLVRAQIVRESFWRQSTLGDFNSDPSTCSPYRGIGNYPPQYNGDRPHNGECPESFGLGQVRYLYHTEAFEDANAIESSAYNLDYTYAVWRDCYEGNLTWLNQVEGRGDYRAGDADGCMGVWFDGRWYTAAARQYIDIVRGHLAERTWERADF